MKQHRCPLYGAQVPGCAVYDNCRQSHRCDVPKTAPQSYNGHPKYRYLESEPGMKAELRFRLH